MNAHNPPHRHARRGVYSLFMGLMAVIILGFGAFAIDISYIAMVKGQAQSVSDAASHAALVAYQREAGHSGDQKAMMMAGIEAARWIVAHNAVGPGPGALADIEFGVFSPEKSLFQANSFPANAARGVVVPSHGGAVELFLAPLLGHHRAPIQAAGLTVTNPREIALVVDLSCSMYEPHNSNSSWSSRGSMGKAPSPQDAWEAGHTLMNTHNAAAEAPATGSMPHPKLHPFEDPHPKGDDPDGMRAYPHGVRDGRDCHRRSTKDCLYTRPGHARSFDRWRYYNTGVKGAARAMVAFGDFMYDTRVPLDRIMGTAFGNRGVPWIPPSWVEDDYTDGLRIQARLAAYHRPNVRRGGGALWNQATCKRMARMYGSYEGFDSRPTNPNLCDVGTCTNPEPAIDLAVRQMVAPPGSALAFRGLIVISDGMANCGGGARGFQNATARAWQAHGVHTWTVAYTGSGGINHGVMTGATRGLGFYRPTPTLDGLTDVMLEIARSIPIAIAE